MSEVLTYEHPDLGTQSAPAGSALALALASEEAWELVDGDPTARPERERVKLATPTPEPKPAPLSVVGDGEPEAKPKAKPKAKRAKPAESKDDQSE